MIPRTVVAIALLFVAVSLAAQTFPDTPAGRIAAAYFQSFNSGDPEKVRQFELQHRSKEGPAARSMDERLAQYREFHDRWGVLEVRQVTPTGASVRVVALASKTQEWLTFNFMLNSDVKLEGIRLTAGTEPPDVDDQKPLDSQERSEVLDRLAAELRTTYVFPEVGKRMAESLDQANYEKLSDPDEFAAALTRDLQAIARDKHLSVRVAAEDRIGAPRRLNYGFEKLEILSGNVGYLKLDWFAPMAEAERVAAAAMTFLSGTDALIIDLRENNGGAPEMIRFLSGYLFDQRTHLNDFYDRVTGKTEESWSRNDVPGPRYGMEKPVFVLTSSRTFSAAEEFTYNLKNLKRATIVGEQSGGGAHPVSPRRLNPRFVAQIPFARAINPITKTNWEGVGVAPDIETSASQALEVAHQKAREATSRRRVRSSNRPVARAD